MCAKILCTILLIRSLLMPSGGVQAAGKESAPAFTVFFTSEQEQFAFTQRSEGAECIMFLSGRVRERHAGPLGADDLRALERLFTAALAGRGEPAGQAVNRDDVIGSAFYFIAAGGQQATANEPSPAPAIMDLLEWVRQHGPALPKVAHDGLYLIAYPIVQSPPSTPVERARPVPELAAAVTQTFRPIRVTGAAQQNRLPRVESEFTLETPGAKKFEVYYVEGPPFSLERWLTPAK